MSEDGLASPVPLVAAAHVPGSWITYGDGADLDGAFDDAVSSAWFDLGRTRTHASVIDVALGDILVDDSQPVPFDVAVAVAQRRLVGLGDGEAVAIRVATPSSYRRRRVNVKVTDPSFTFPGAPGRVPFVSGELAVHLSELAAATESEQLGAVDLRRAVRAGYKPFVEKNVGKNVTQYGVFVAGSWAAPLSLHVTASEARRWAVAVVKAGPVNGDETVVLEVRPVISRNDQHALITVERRRVRQAAAVRVELWEPKDHIRQCGWIIAGCAPGLTNDDAKGLSLS